MRIGVTRIAGRIGVLVALLVVLSALIAHPSPRMPPAGARHAEVTIVGPAHPETRGILPATTAERAALRANEPSAPDTHWLRISPSRPYHPAPPHAPARRPSPAPEHLLTDDGGSPAHPPRAPPLA